MQKLTVFFLIMQFFQCINCEKESTSTREQCLMINYYYLEKLRNENPTKDFKNTENLLILECAMRKSNSNSKKSLCIK